MLTLIVFSALAVLLVWALYRRPGGVTAALALSYIAAVAFSSLMEREQLRPMLAVIDASVALGMLFAWAHYQCQHARAIGAIALLKCAWAVPYVVMPLPWNTYAAGINTAFLLQVLIAGGFADGIADWLDRHVWRFRDSRARVRNDVGR